MLLNISRLIGCKVHASDGDAGEIRDVYFDSRRWAIQYFVVQTGSWFSSKKVLLSPGEFFPRNASWDHADVKLTKEQVEQSPDVKLDLAVSRATEEGAQDYYALPGFRAPETRKGYISIVNTTFGIDISVKKIPEARYLYNVMNILSYTLLTSDDESAAMEDFLADDRSWYLHYAVIDTDRWLSRKRILLPVSLIDTISDEDAVVTVDLRKKALTKSPAYDPSRPVRTDYEQSLFKYYNRVIPPYAEWRFDREISTMSSGRNLRIEVLAPAVVHWSADNWKTVNETKTKDTGRGMHIALLNTANARPGASVQFTFFWLLVKRWEGRNFAVRVQVGRREQALEPARV